MVLQLNVCFNEIVLHFLFNAVDRDFGHGSFFKILPATTLSKATVWLMSISTHHILLPVATAHWLLLTEGLYAININIWCLLHIIKLVSYNFIPSLSLTSAGSAIIALPVRAKWKSTESEEALIPVTEQPLELNRWHVGARSLLLCWVEGDLGH